MTNPAYILEDAGFTRDQVNALTVYWDGSVATKEDIAHLDGKIKDLRSELKEDIAHLRSELKEDIGHLRSELREDIGHLRSELKEDIGHLEGRIDTMAVELRYIKWIGAAILVGIFIPLIKDFTG